MPRVKFPSRQETDKLSFRELCDYDNICTDILIDHTGYHTTVAKTTRYTPMRALQSEDVIKVLTRNVVINGNLDAAKDAILALPGPNAYVDRLQTQAERNNFYDHFDLYLNMYLVDCPWEVSSTNRYQIGSYESTVVARMRIEKDIMIPFLVGKRVTLEKEEDKAFSQGGFDFSVMTSQRTQESSLMLGPARLANHDCSANAMLEPIEGGVQIKSTRVISSGEEITVFYGGSYFGAQNQSCLCATCETLVRNGWSAQATTDLTNVPDVIYKDNNRRAGDYLVLRKILRGTGNTKSKKRTPKDYVLTPRLLAQPYDRWVQCTNDSCLSNFVQQDGWETKLECPRCRRHRVLYGLEWPKVQTALLATDVDADPENYAEQGKCGKGRWVKGVRDENQRMLDGQVTSEFMSQWDARKMTRRGLLLEATLAKRKGHEISDTGDVDMGNQPRRSKRRHNTN